MHNVDNSFRIQNEENKGSRAQKRSEVTVATECTCEPENREGVCWVACESRKP